MERSRREESRIGYFAALYRKVTVKVRDGIASGRFEDGPRMERLDVLFAGRYLDAIDRFRNGAQPSRSWQTAFDAAGRWRPIILQHLLLGINAHINIDLGIAAAETAPGPRLPALKHDFDRINDILSELMDEVQTEIGALSPWVGLLDRIAGSTDEAVMNFSLGRARAAAWGVAATLASSSPEQQAAEIRKLDGEIDALARLIRDPGRLVGAVTLLIRLGERKSVSQTIDVLE